MRVLVTGANGYVGGRLAPELIRAGHQVRCSLRRPEALAEAAWAADVEVVEADARDRDGFVRAMTGGEVVYYLIHSLAGGARFAEIDALCARNAAAAAAAAGVSRIVYLGGPLPPAHDASPHLASRAEVANILSAGPVPTITLRAAVILGSGSASFEMLRYLTERLPVMVAPRWVRSRVQPIAIRDVLRYLVGVLDLDAHLSRGFDIGGPDVMTYKEMMQCYARVAGVPRRIVLEVPWLSLGLSSAWVNLVTPIPARIARPLIESLRHDAVAQEHDIEALLGPPTLGVEDAIGLAIERVRDREVPTRWSDASWPARPPRRRAASSGQVSPSGQVPPSGRSDDSAPADPFLPTTLDPSWAGGPVYSDERVAEVRAPAEVLWQTVEGIGGDRGWYSLPVAWWVRGVADRVIGGVGLRRGRRDPDRLAVGDAVDFWRVEALERGERLLLLAEMRLPGPAWLEFQIEATGETTSRLVQRAVFRPRGLSGHLYWWSISPFHGVVFGEMARNLARAAEAAWADEQPRPEMAADR